MDVDQPLQLLGGLSPQLFMKRHWQKKPLLVRQAIPGFKPLLDRGELFELASREDVQARMVIQQQGKHAPGWRFRQGPFERRALPALKQPGWTLLLQGVDLQHQAVHDLMNKFRFVPDARLDDLMISYATDGGGVGPHVDSYDVFLQIAAAAGAKPIVLSSSAAKIERAKALGAVAGFFGLSHGERRSAGAEADRAIRNVSHRGLP